MVLPKMPRHAIALGLGGKATFLTENSILWLIIV